MKRLFTLLSLKLFFATVSLSQNLIIDSLIHSAFAAPLDSTRVTLLNDVAMSLREIDGNLAFKYAEEAMVLAEKLQYSKGLAKVQANLGWIYYRQGRFSKALEMSSKALQTNQKIGDKREIADCLINIGAIHLEQKYYPTAIANFKKAYDLGSEIGVSAIRSRCLNNIAFCFLKTLQLDSARYYTMRAIDENINDDFRAAFSKRTLGDVYYEEGNYAAALEKWKECLRSATLQTNNFLVVSTLVRLAKIHLKLWKPDQAITYLNQSIPTAKKYKFKSSTWRANSTI